MFDSGVILLRKIRYLSLLGIKGLNAVFFEKKIAKELKSKILATSLNEML